MNLTQKFLQEEKILHEGHRERMYGKLESEETLYDHELLEMLLYNAYPRMNTNPIAHALLERFVTLSEVFDADVAELETVEGVGKACARYIKTVGLCYKRIIVAAEGAVVLKTYGDCVKFASIRLRGKREEYLELYLTQKSGKIKRIVSFTTEDMNRVTVTAEKIVEVFAYAKPFAVIAAHNHLNGNVQPSKSDDMFTKQLQLICSMNGVALADHLIYGGPDNVYSYFDSGKLSEIKKNITLDAAVNWISYEKGI